MEFQCPGCGRRARLIPHGAGRYALPGQPPPDAVPAEDRLPPWMRGQRMDGREASVPPAMDPTPEPVAPEVEPEPPEEPAPTYQHANLAQVADALEVLGVEVSATAEEIDEAFRARSLTCHPDKVAHLDEDIQALAAEKFNRLRAAYTFLRE